MDPDANLAELRREITEYIRIADVADRQFDEGPDADRIVELVQALDEWISKGGFLPVAWRVPAPKPDGPINRI